MEATEYLTFREFFRDKSTLLLTHSFFNSIKNTAVDNSFRREYRQRMKRALAIIVVAILAIGMVALAVLPALTAGTR